MKLIWRIKHRYFLVRARRARLHAGRFEKKAEKFLLLVKGVASK